MRAYVSWGIFRLALFCAGSKAGNVLLSVISPLSPYRLSALRHKTHGHFDHQAFFPVQKTFDTDKFILAWGKRDTLERAVAEINEMRHLQFNVSGRRDFRFEAAGHDVAQRPAGVEHRLLAFIIDHGILEQFEQLKESVANIRSIRKEKGIPNKESLELKIRFSANGHYHDRLEPVLQKMVNVSSVEFTDVAIEGSGSFIIKNVEYFVPLKGMIDKNEELVKLENELNYTIGFLESVMKKLNNANFVQNAPDKVVEIEKRKKADAEAKIKVLESRINNLKS